ncbi:MAG: VanZ family protein [Steroidobacteraceae bacterium]
MASRPNSAAPLLLAVVVALIVYVSLYPFRFEAHGPSLLDALDHMTWARAGRGEMLNNVLLYLPFGFCFVLLVEPRFGRTAGLVAAALAGAALSLYMELLQASEPVRVSSYKDLTLNAVGALAGAGIGSVWHLLGARMVPQSTPQSRGRAVVIAILVLWLLARLWPLVPGLDLRQVKNAVRPLFSPHIRPADLAAFFVGWLVVAQAVFALARKQRAVDAFLVVIAVVLVGRTVVIDHTLVAAELAAIALLLPVLVLLSRLGDATRSMLVAAVLGTWLAWTALAPAMVHGGPADVDLPALAEFISRNPPPPADLAAKGFGYLALAWLLAGAGLLPHVAAGVTVLFVAILCLLQLGLAAPVYSWVDVVIALIAGFVVARWR